MNIMNEQLEVISVDGNYVTLQDSRGSHFRYAAIGMRKGDRVQITTELKILPRPEPRQETWRDRRPQL